MDWKNERIELINKYCEMGRRYCQVIVGKNDRKVSNEDNDDTGYKDIWKWLKDMVSNVDKQIEIENDL